MWVDRLTSSNTTRALELAAQFAERRQQVLAENLANIDTPGYQTRRLDRDAFQASLQQALEQAGPANKGRLELRGNAQFASAPDGRVVARPEIEPADNVLFHDGTNARLEKLIADTNENGLTYELALELLRGKLGGLLSAIRGRVG